MTTKAKPPQKKDTAPEALTALGNCCLALSQTIGDLSRAGHNYEAKKLVDELTLNSRMLRSQVGELAAGMPSISQADATKWMSDFLADGPKLAAEIFEEAEKAGLSKSQVFKAKDELDLIVGKRGRLQVWELGTNSEPAPCTGDCS